MIIDNLGQLSIFESGVDLLLSWGSSWEEQEKELKKQEDMRAAYYESKLEEPGQQSALSKLLRLESDISTMKQNRNITLLYTGLTVLGIVGLGTYLLSKK